MLDRKCKIVKIAGSYKKNRNSFKHCSNACGYLFWIIGTFLGFGGLSILDLLFDADFQVLDTVIIYWCERGACARMLCV